MIRVALIVLRSDLLRESGRETAGLISSEIGELTFTQLAPLLPRDRCRVEAYDEQRGPVPWPHIRADIVAISARAATIDRAYAHADFFRARGTAVVLGGIHPTLNPEEAAPRCDAVVRGIAVQAWPEIISDFGAGRMQAVYDFRHSSLFVAKPFERFDSVKSRGGTRSVYSTYGCPQRCAFCVQPETVIGYYRRPPADVLDEIRQIASRSFVFADPNLTADRDHALELFRLLLSLNRRWMMTTGLDFAVDPELVRVAADAGCQMVFLGFESLHRTALERAGKRINFAIDYDAAIENLHSHGISVVGSFVLGLDGDDRRSTCELIRFAARGDIDVPRFTINTPFPGTEYHRRLAQAGRIVATDRAFYDSYHAVIRSELLSAAELRDLFVNAHLEVSGLRWLARRLARRRSLRQLARDFDVSRRMRRLAERLGAL